GKRGGAVRGAPVGPAGADQQGGPAVVAGSAAPPADEDQRRGSGGGEQSAGPHHAHQAPFDALHGLGGGAGALLGRLRRGRLLAGLLLGRALLGVLLLGGGLLLLLRGLGLGGRGLLLPVLLGELRRAHPVRGGGRRRLEAHPSVLGPEPHLRPGVRVLRADGPLLAVLLAGREAD